MDIVLVDFNFSFFLNKMLLGKSGFYFKAPLNLTGMESGGLVADAIA